MYLEIGVNRRSVSGVCFLFRLGVNQKMLEIQYKKTEELIPYANNPRLNDQAVDAVAASIEEFGFKVPIIIDAQNEIVAGHTRLKAAKKLGLDVVPVVVADDLSEEQIRAFRLVDNRTGELADWDEKRLADELELALTDFDMELFGFIPVDLDEGVNPYSPKTDIPHYEITSTEKPDFIQLYDDFKTQTLLEEIEASDVSEEEKTFLRLGAYRHIKFNFGQIAEYYAHASQEMQELMEDSALVIIDLEDAMRRGYVQMLGDFEAMAEGELDG